MEKTGNSHRIFHGCFLVRRWEKKKKSGWYYYKQTSPPKPNGYLHYQLIEYSKCPRENGSTWNSLEHLTAGGAVVNCILRGSCRRREREEGHEGGGWSGTFSVLHITSLQSHISSTYSDIWHCVNDIVCMADADGSFFFFFFFLLTASLTNLGSHRLHVNACHFSFDWNETNNGNFCLLLAIIAPWETSRLKHFFGAFNLLH